MASAALARQRRLLRTGSCCAWGVTLLCMALYLHRGFTEPDFQLREFIVIASGRWALRLLLLTLLVAPLAHALHRPWLRQFRRPAGLITFGWCALHALFYIWSAQLWPHQLHMLWQRPYLLCGTVALLLLVPMALSSSNLTMRKLGPLLWRRIHRAIYPVLVLCLAHELLFGHDSYAEIGVHLGLATTILGLRLRHALRRHGPRTRTQRASVEFRSPDSRG